MENKFTSEIYFWVISAIRAQFYKNIYNLKQCNWNGFIHYKILVLFLFSTVWQFFVSAGDSGSKYYTQVVLNLEFSKPTFSSLE